MNPSILFLSLLSIFLFSGFQTSFYFVFMPLFVSQNLGGLAYNQVRECCWQDSSQGFWASQHRLSSQSVATPSPAQTCTAVKNLSSLAPLSHRVYSHTMNNILWTCTSITCVFSNKWEDLMPGRKSVPEVPTLCCAHWTIQAMPSVTQATRVTPLYILFLIFQSHFTCKWLYLRKDYSSHKQLQS